jgi:hypothetical protein
MDAITIDSAASLTGLRTRLAAAAGPLLIDCKISAAVCGEHAGLVGPAGPLTRRRPIAGRAATWPDNPRNLQFTRY